MCTHRGRTKTPTKATGKRRWIFSEGERHVSATDSSGFETGRSNDTFIGDRRRVVRLLLDRKRKNTYPSPRGSTYLRDCSCAREDGKGGIMLILGCVKRVLSVLLTVYTCYVCTCFFSSIKGLPQQIFSFFYRSFRNDTAERRFLLQVSPAMPPFQVPLPPVYRSFSPSVRTKSVVSRCVCPLERD